MRTAVTDDQGSVVLLERERPEPGPGQLLIKVEASGICGSDLHMLELAHSGNVLGHEFVGTVVGSGRRVCAVPVHSCQACAACLTGHPIECPSAKYMGGHRAGKKADGSFAEYTVVDEASSITIPDTVSRDQAAFVEPLAVALKAVEKARFEINDRLVILGAGPIGLAVLLWARTNGVGHVTVSDPVAPRRAAALALGATAAVAPEELEGAPDVVIECAGRPGMFDQAVRLVRREGRVVVLGMHMHDDTFHPREPLLKNVTVSFCAQYAKAHFEHTVRILANGQLDPTPVITHRVALDELPRITRELRTPNAFGKVLVLS